MSIITRPARPLRWSSWALYSAIGCQRNKGVSTSCCLPPVEENHVLVISVRNDGSETREVRERVSKVIEKLRQKGDCSPSNGYWMIGPRYLIGIFLVSIITIAISHPAGVMITEEWYDKGLFLSHEGRYTDAIDAYVSAVVIGPTVVTHWGNGLGIVHDHEGDCTNALRAYEVAITLDPTNVFSWKNKGIALGN